MPSTAPPEATAVPPASAASGRPEDSAILAAIEERVLQQVGTRLDDITSQISAYLSSVIREHAPLTGNELVSRDDVHVAIGRTLDAAHDRIDSTVRASYRAAGAAARASAENDLPDYQLPPAPEADPPYLAAVITALVLAFTVALTDIIESVRAAYDSVTGTALIVASARILAVHTALDRAVRRIGVRTRSAATVAVNRGYTDAQAYIYAGYRRAHPSILMRKQWVATAADPCPSCRDLHGQVVDIDAEFDPDAGRTPRFRPPRVWRDLQGPPRHPHCRCRLVYLPGDQTVAVRAITTARPPAGSPTRLSAADVRNMPAPRLNALIAYFKAATRKLTTLLRRRNPGA